MGCHARSIIDEGGACKADVELIGIQALGSRIRDVGGKNLELGVDVRRCARAQRYVVDCVEILRRNTSDLGSSNLEERLLYLDESDLVLAGVVHQFDGLSIIRPGSGVKWNANTLC